MSHRTPILRAGSLSKGLALAGLLLFAGFGHAEDDDFEFAQALAGRGYSDLAEEQFQKILSDPKRKASEKAEGTYGLALLKRRDAVLAAREEREKLRKKLGDVLAIFQQAEDSLASFITGNPTHARILEAKLDRSKLISERAEYINKSIRNGWVPGDVTEADLRKQVAEGFDTSIDLLKALEDPARSKLERCSPGTPEYRTAEDELGLVWLSRIAALYGKGAALPPGDTSGIAALNQVLAEIDEFMWLFDGTVRGLWAFHYSGLANWKLDKPKDAMRDIRDAATALTEGDGVPAGRPITMMSYDYMATIAIDAANRHGDEYIGTALKAFDKLPSAWPSFMEDRFGQMAALAHARVLDHTGRSDEAISLVQKVIKKAKENTTYMDRPAGTVLGEMLSHGGSGADLDPALLKTIAKSKWSDADYSGAIRAYQSVIQASTGDSKRMNDFGWDAWDMIGRCYGLQERWYEAYLAFDMIEQGFMSDQTNEKLIEMTDETGFSRAATIDQLARRTTDKARAKHYADLSKRLVEEFTERHPNSPRNVGADLAKAAGILKEAKQLLRAGDTAAAQSKFSAAQSELKSIDRTSTSIDLVDAQSIECDFYLARMSKDAAKMNAAVDGFIKWLAVQRKPVVDSGVRRARATGKNLCLVSLLKGYALIPDMTADAPAKKVAYADLIKAIDKWGAQFLDVVSRGQLTLDQWRVEALIGTGEVSKADELASKNIRESPESVNGPFLAAIVANALEKEAKVRLEKGDTTGYQNLMLRCARLREYAVLEPAKRKGVTPSPGAFVSLGNTFREAGDFAKAEEYLRLAQAGYVAAGNEDQARALLVELIGLLIDQGKFAEAITDLEALLVPVEADRAGILERLGRDDQLTNVEVKKMTQTKMSKNRRVLDVLSRAYLQAARDDKDLVRCINLCGLLRFAHPKDEKHDVKYIEYTVRLASAYFKFGVDYGQPDAFKNVVKLIQNGIVTPGLLETYGERVPGSKQKLTELLNASKNR